MENSASFSVKCGRCGVRFITPHCPKLDHFSIYRVTCPRCSWPGRYLASELRPTGASEQKLPPSPRKAS